MNNFFSSKTSSSGVGRCFRLGEGGKTISQALNFKSELSSWSSSKMMGSAKGNISSYYSNTIPSRENVKRTKASLLAITHDPIMHEPP